MSEAEEMARDLVVTMLDVSARVAGFDVVVADADVSTEPRGVTSR
ncbi:hypothetical protein [Nonomuraea salmonea]|uniref:Uncharacterized protein n=1 Tax=Nonomuraea salmonea TaxID=46181 RepID=A0ABV5NS41_9ACTN